MNQALALIEIYGLDKPHTAFNHGLHLDFKLRDIKDGNGLTLKTFEQPVYVYVSGKIRSEKPRYGKYVVSVTNDQADFIRQVEHEIVDKFDALAVRAEPALNVESLKFGSLLYENLLQIRVSRTVGQDKEGKLVKFTEHETVLSKGTSVIATVEISGVYHSQTHKGTVAKLHSYRVV